MTELTELGQHLFTEIKTTNNSFTEGDLNAFASSTTCGDTEWRLSEKAKAILHLIERITDNFPSALRLHDHAIKERLLETGNIQQARLCQHA